MRGLTAMLNLLVLVLIAVVSYNVFAAPIAIALGGSTFAWVLAAVLAFVIGVFIVRVATFLAILAFGILAMILAAIFGRG